MVFQFFYKSALLFLLSWIFIFPVNAQFKFSEDKNYDDLFNEAKQSDKPMFIVIHNNGDQFSPFKDHISQKTRDALQTQFVSGTVHLNREDFNHHLNKIFHLSSPIYLFADKDGFPILRHNSPIKDEQTLARLIDSAYTLSKGETLGKLTGQYRKGMRNRLLLTTLLTKYQTLDMYADQQVLSDYIAQLTVQELNNFETIIFLLSSGPVFNSQNYLLARTNSKMVDSLYSTLPLPQRVKINNRIIQQTFREALNKKDVLLAESIGNFTVSTWGTNYLRAITSSRFHPLEYKRLIGDSISYVLMARNYYDHNYYKVAPDSLSRIDFKSALPKKGTPWNFVLDSTENALYMKTAEISINNIKDEQARSLNYGSEQILVFGKNNVNALFDAIRWQYKAISLYPNSGRYHHTMARLLYQVGFYAQAEFEQQQAILHYKSNKEVSRQMQVILKQMQNRKL